MCDEFWMIFAIMAVYKHITKPHLNTYSSLFFILALLLFLREGGLYLSSLL
jgi:hypothetical protein